MNKLKLYTQAFIKSIDEEKFIIWGKASEAIVDRDKELIRWDAWDTKDFLKHPVLLVSHEYHKLWVARVNKLDKREDGLFFEAKFSDKTEASREAWNLIKETNMAAFSVGFLPSSYKEIKVNNLKPLEKESALVAGLRSEDKIRVYTKVKLLEISLVSVPSVPTALLIAWKGKRIKTKSLQDALADVEIVFEPEPKITKETIDQDIERALRTPEIREQIDKLVQAKLAGKEIEPVEMSGILKKIQDNLLTELKQPKKEQESVEKDKEIAVIKKEGKKAAKKHFNVVEQIKLNILKKAGKVIGEDENIDDYFEPKKDDPELIKKMKELTDLLLAKYTKVNKAR